VNIGVCFYTKLHPKIKKQGNAWPVSQRNSANAQQHKLHNNSTNAQQQQQSAPGTHQGGR